MAGTAAGTVFLYTVTTSIRITKEIQLKHGAPVLSIIVLDSTSNPIHPPSSTLQFLPEAARHIPREGSTNTIPD
jgi:hypothetical protein